MVRVVVIGLCAFVSLGALIFGMDGGYFSGVLAMNNFIEDFGSLNPVTHAYYISAGRQSFMNSFPYLGQLLAALCGGLIADLLGRKWGLVIMVMTSVCGVLMQLFARHEALFVTGRFVNCKFYSNVACCPWKSILIANRYRSRLCDDICANLPSRMFSQRDSWSHDHPVCVFDAPCKSQFD